MDTNRYSGRRAIAGTALWAIPAFLLSAVAVSADAQAQSPSGGPAGCSNAEVSAKGEAASYRWLALIKARGNWRGKVRAIPSLGSAYATFNSAQNPTERCIFNTGCVVCTVTATPCRR